MTICQHMVHLKRAHNIDKWQSTSKTTGISKVNMFWKSTGRIYKNIFVLMKETKYTKPTSTNNGSFLPPPLKDWFIWIKDTRNTKPLLDQNHRHDNLLGDKNLGQKQIIYGFTGTIHYLQFDTISVFFCVKI